jgi:hypothetical protein
VRHDQIENLQNESVREDATWVLVEIWRVR